MLLTIAGESLLALTVLASTARADVVSFTLTNPTLSGLPNATLTFQGTITNISANPEFLNGDSSTTSLTLNDSAFFANVPASLAVGSGVGPVDLFSATAPALPGTYDLNFFTLTGGMNGSSTDTLATAEFTVIVTSPSTVPEPATIALLGTGLVGLLALARRAAQRRKILRGVAKSLPSFPPCRMVRVRANFLT